MEERRLAETCCSYAPSARPRRGRFKTAPEDWRAQTPEQNAAINQLHIAAIAEHSGIPDA